MTNLSTYVPELLRLVRQKYPDWQDFSHPPFVTDEIAYKRTAANFARDHLDRKTLAALLDTGDTDGFIARLKSVAGKTNLLFMGTPRTGDLAFINQPDADLFAIARATFNLLHGDSDAAERLSVFLEFVAAEKLPQKWTFPTYLLFLLYPETEIFIKPGVTNWLSKFTAGAIPFGGQPSAAMYAAIRQGFHEIRDSLEPYGATDMIDIQSFVYVANKADKPSAQFEKAVDKLRAVMGEMGDYDDLVEMNEKRNEVYARYSRSFAPEYLLELSADEYRSFLLFENNRHWTGIHRYGGRTVRDMDGLRRALAVLTDEGRPLAERYEEATGGMVEGIGRAIATPILHVVYPDRYGIWNSKSHTGLEIVGALPKFEPGWTEGQKYEALNDVLLRLASALEIDLWTLDTLWELLSRRRPLAPPFDSIFADRAQAEWAFDLFADAVGRLGGGPDDSRFALTLPNHGTMMRLNIGNSMVMDIAHHGQDFHLTALIDEMEHAYDFSRTESFRVTVKGTADQFAVYTLPADVVRDWPAGLQAIFEHSMAKFGKEFVLWQQSNLRRAHSAEIFEAFFDEEKRDKLLTQGISIYPPEPSGDDPPPPPPGPTIAAEFKGFTMDAFDFLRELQANNNKAWMEANRERWRENVLEPMRALFSDLGPHVKRLFDPYLLPEELEIAPTAHKVLARINKNWSATPDSKYHEYYWGAFYRRSLSRQTDAQLFINILHDHLRFGYYVGEQAKQPRSRLRERVLSNRDTFFDLIMELGLTNRYDFIRTDPHGRHDMIPIRTVEELSTWMEDGSFDVLMPLTPEQAIAAGPALADTILDTFRRVFPIYLWAVADDHLVAVERYLTAEFPPDEDDEEIEPPPHPYTFTDFQRETHLATDRAEDLRAMLLDKRQAIFYGPPGTGKTYVARHLGRLLTGLDDPPPERLTVVQFHPAYGYEEFIEGIRPESVERDGLQWVNYPPRPGVFVRFCREAARLGDAPCVFVIDEINRGNIPRIFGELMLLLEYRDQDVPLPYSGERFRIPRNVYLIGTMNTADRSIALVDFALRRRFHFAHFTADPDLFDRWLIAHPPTLPWLGALYRRLSGSEGIDDADFAIGPSLFMREDLDEAGLERVWRWSVLPYLREYYLERADAVRRWEWDSPEMRRLRLDTDDGGPDGEIVGL